MARTYVAQLFTSKRVANQHRAIDLESVHYGHDVLAESIRRVARGWRAGSTEPSAGNSKYVIPRGQLRREPIEDVGVVAKPGQQNNRASRAAPIEHFQLDTRFNSDELDLVRGRIERHGRAGSPCTMRRRGQKTCRGKQCSKQHAHDGYPRGEDG